MSVEANLLVTFDSYAFILARREIIDVLKKVGVNNPEFLRSGAKGVFAIRVSIDPQEAVRGLVALCRAEPDRFWYTYQWVPIEVWCSSIMDEVSKVVSEFAKRILPSEKWRIRLNKRFYQVYHSRELVESLAELVDNPNVDLENPDKIIRVEIIGSKAGLSLLEPDEELSVNRIKTSTSKGDEGRSL